MWTVDSAQVRHGTPGGDAPDGERIRAAEVITALSLATDLGIGVPLEHGLHSTLIAMRLVERAGVDAATASQTYYACLLFYVGCAALAVQPWRRLLRAERDAVAQEVESLPLPGIEGRIVVRWDD